MANPDPLQLSDLLNDWWLPKLRSTLETPGAGRFIGPDRSSSIVPLRELTFRAIVHHPPQKWSVVIFGQNPYPRVESALGVACCDGQVVNWRNNLSPTLRNVIKGVLVHKGLVTTSDDVHRVRAQLQNYNAPQPLDWFQYTIERGVLWLNTSLTTGDADVNAHAKFWRPCVERVLDVILEAKKDLLDTSPTSHQGVVFVLWGNHAQKLKKVIQKINLQHCVPVRFVEAPNPAVEQFHSVNSFDQINSALVEMGLDTIDWLPDAATALALSRGGDAEDMDAATEAAADPSTSAGAAETRVNSLADAVAVANPELPVKRARVEAQAPPASNEAPPGGSEECKICMDAKVNCIVMDCGHYAFCLDCAKQLKNCAICRRKIGRVVKIYHS